MPFPKTPDHKEKKTVSASAKKHLMLLIINTLIFFSVYQVLLYCAESAENAYWSFLVMLLYFALLLGFTIAYLIYNRFLSRKGLRPEDLDPTWSEEKKAAFLADGEERLERSKWMMTIILPLILIFLFDAIDLFIIHGVLSQ